MLSRVADNLFWMGRYIERVEHLTRYLNVQYFSSIEVPYPQLRERALYSILDLVSQKWRESRPSEEEILVSVAFNERNPESILQLFIMVAKTHVVCATQFLRRYGKQ
ncbi:MAG: alpha-E domain-containing protein [Bacteroidales bacterium]|nr:alpha-E domain-containing protein [Bacteroidales bacterium]